jgi:bZIP transcription factor.
MKFNKSLIGYNIGQVEALIGRKERAYQEQLEEYESRLTQLTAENERLVHKLETLKAECDALELQKTALTQ